MHQKHNFLIIIGAAKAGTTSLARWLGSRPDMVLGRQKEPRYFTNFVNEIGTWSGPRTDHFIETLIGDDAAYFDNFSHKPYATWAIDASTDYLWQSEITVQKLQDFSQAFPVKLICLTRDPIKRAISEYNHTLNLNIEPLSFRESLDAEAERSAKGCHPLFRHQRRSRIHADLQRYADAFGDDLLVMDHDALKNPETVNNAISRFLGIDVQAFENIRVHNQRPLPRNSFVKKLWDAKKLRSLGRTVIPSPVRHALSKRLTKPNAQVITVSEDEIDYAQELLADEIELCQADPLIDTLSWTLALR